MAEDKEKITIGKTTMWAQTVPISCIFKGRATKISVEIMEMDGYFIVIKAVLDPKNNIQTAFKCFLHQKDALSYLDMYGIKETDPIPSVIKDHETNTRSN